MRMWMVEPKLMCRKHLLGEHVELHMLAGTIKRSKSIKGFIANGLLAPEYMQLRHKQLVAEMKARGFNHKSELPEVDLSNYSQEIRKAVVNISDSLQELARRCPDCRGRQKEGL